jgi:hypothetical protein
MSVVVYPRLAELLAARHLSVAELERQIEERYGLTINAKTLYRLTQPAPIQRADLEIVGATAAILGVGLDDLFTVNAVATDEDPETEARMLSAADSRRMAVLVGRQAQRLLTDEEWAELEDLVAKYGRLLHERRLRERAGRRGVPYEQEKRETEAHLAAALEQWNADEMERQQQAILKQAVEQGTP